jgi:hypothetical protein
MLIRPGVGFSQNPSDAFVRLEQRLLGSGFEISKLQNITAHFEATVYYRQKRSAGVNAAETPSQHIASRSSFARWKWDLP